MKKELFIGLTGFLSIMGLFAIVAAVFQVHAQVPHGTMYEETPTGILDGLNTVFTIAHQPAPWSSIKLYRNGLRQRRWSPSQPLPPVCVAPGCCDYNLDTSNWNATKIVFIPIPIVPPGSGMSGTPQPGDILLVDYTY
jgi:hypothetical protein